MPGQIATALQQLRDARNKLVEETVEEIGQVLGEVEAARVDKSKALDLARGEIAVHRREIQEIRNEFAQASNGGPPGPLPGDSAPPSGPSGPAEAADGSEHRAVTFASLHPSHRSPMSQKVVQ